MKSGGHSLCRRIIKHEHGIVKVKENLYTSAKLILGEKLEGKGGEAGEKAKGGKWGRGKRAGKG